uniref:Uncharacterized protein n=1 Tax=Ditylenchus dipsaci TaxID=166011 RepID=A0A915E4C4_9BILA
MKAVEKLTHLKALLAHEASYVLRGLPITDANYRPAVQILQALVRDLWTAKCWDDLQKLGGIDTKAAMQDFINIDELCENE